VDTIDPSNTTASRAHTREINRTLTPGYLILDVGCWMLDAAAASPFADEIPGENPKSKIKHPISGGVVG
jgi:hypothetical protein